MAGDKRHRIKYIDNVKCFAIFLVVWGHVVQRYGSNLYINNLIYSQIILSFHMPLFAILSGFFLRVEENFWSYFGKKTKQLLLPLIVWCIISFGIFIPLRNYLVSSSDDLVFNTSYIFIIRRIISEILYWGWWFLRALYLCFIYAYFAIRVSKCNYGLGLIASIIILYLLGWSGIIPNMNSSLNGFFFLYPFFCIGKIISVFDLYICKNLGMLFFLSTILFIVGLLYWKGYPDSFYEMNTSLRENEGFFDIVGSKVVERTFVRFLTGLSGSLVCIFLFRFIDMGKADLSFKVFSNIGSHTLEIYIMHSFIFDILPSKDLFQSQLAGFLGCIVISIFTIYASMKISNILSKIKLCSLLLWGK